MYKQLCGLMVVCLLTGVAFAGEALEARGEVTEVVLYRGQALVTREVPFAAPAGPVQLLVTDLPERVEPDSLFANAGPDIQIRAVRFRTQAVYQAPRDQVRELDSQIAEVQMAQRENAQSQRLLAQQQAYLDGLQSFTAPTAQAEMTRGVLNADTLAQVTAMIFERREELSNRSLELQEAERALRERLSLLQRRRAALTSGHGRILRQAIVFLEKAGPEDSSIELSYLVGNATWEPTYNLRADGDLNAVNVEYAAIAQQMSGEDWDNVTLTLSTAAARMVATGPTLAPMTISLTPQHQPLGYDALRGRYQDTRKHQELLQRSDGRADQLRTQWGWNWAAQAGQNIELAVGADRLHLLRDDRVETAAGLSVNYRLPGKVSLASRRDSQMVEIARLTLPATFYYEAVPLLSEQVHRYAELTNTSELSLLEGRSHMYLDGDYVGRGLMSMVARGQKLTVGFGVEPQLRAWREFVDKDERIQGGNRNINMTFRLVLDNYADRDIDLRVLDRIPPSREDLRVTLEDLEDPLSTDAEYVRALKPRGILRWDITIEAGAAANTARIIDYSYMLEFDRNLHIATEAPVTTGRRPEPADVPADVRDRNRRYLEAQNALEDLMRY